MNVEKAEYVNDLIKINYSGTQPTVSARDLHEGLEIGTEFRKWFPRMAEYGFIENADWKRVSQKCPTPGGTQEVVDYHISVDMAKQICMIQRSEKGMQYRQYFLDLEKAWNTPEQILARALHMADEIVSSLKERCKFLGGQIVEQQKVIEEMQPKVSYYDLVLQCKDVIAATIIAKDYGMSAMKFNDLLHEKGIQFKQCGTWVLYAEYQGKGYLKTKTHNYADSEGIQHTREHSYWTQKGRLFLYEFLKKEGILPVIERTRKEEIE